MIAAYILIQTDVGRAAMVAAALRDVPGVWGGGERGRVLRRHRAGAGARHDELGKLVTSQVQALDGVQRTMSCPVVHL
jgi:hypothetical protein